jgi:hypothetical protein
LDVVGWLLVGHAHYSVLCDQVTGPGARKFPRRWIGFSVGTAGPGRAGSERVVGPLPEGEPANQPFHQSQTQQQLTATTTHAALDLFAVALPLSFSFD